MPELINGKLRFKKGLITVVKESKLFEDRYLAVAKLTFASLHHKGLYYVRTNIQCTREAFSLI